MLGYMYTILTLVSFLILQAQAEDQNPAQLTINDNINGTAVAKKIEVNFQYFPDSSTAQIDFKTNQFPVSYKYKDEIRIFIANEKKTILELRLNHSGDATGHFYTTPYKLVKNYTVSDEFQVDSGFDAEGWRGNVTLIANYIPQNQSRISAAYLRHTEDGLITYDNYYHYDLSPFSIVDLMIVERYQDTKFVID